MQLALKYEKGAIRKALQDRLALANPDLDSPETVESCISFIVSSLGLDGVVSVKAPFGAPYSQKDHYEEEIWKYARFSLASENGVGVADFQAATAKVQAFLSADAPPRDTNESDRDAILAVLARHEPHAGVPFVEVRRAVELDKSPTDRHKFQHLIDELRNYVDHYCPDGPDDRDNETVLYLKPEGRKYLSSKGLL